ncbi:MAG: GMC family oxidoreductase [Pseudomonadales bacterium]|nr:GMC family oxidoreductase [Pseudomonadales bacterium]
MNHRDIRTVDIEVAQSRHWDVVIVGGGMGGAAAAHKLTELGYEVLLVEKGKADMRPASSDAGAWEAARRHGQWTERINSAMDGRSSNILPPLGCGVGGSTLLYAATLGRLDPIDFESRCFPDGRRGGWPLSYSDMQPYYLEAERLFEVSGTPDPLQPAAEYALSPPPAMNESDRHLFGSMRQTGLHPYRVHLSMRYAEGCVECGGHYCPLECKGDARNRLVIPALRSGRLSVLENSQVVQLEAIGSRITKVVIISGSVSRSLTADVYLLAAGALATPVLLQNSTSRAWPRGIGNETDQVGRNLMFHASDLIAVWPRKKLSRGGPRRSIALRDFYVVEGRKLGELQSMGLTAGYGDILTYLLLRFEQSRLRKLSPLRHVLRIPAFLGSMLLREATVFATIVEDFPYVDNRVLADGASESGIRFEYIIHEELRSRVLEMRRRVRDALDDHRVLQMTYDVSLNLGHPCGTCRMGLDPQSSVVDQDCKVHGTENLYIVDGSVMPTSGGTNPSLTIAANALRVADRIQARHAA